MDSDSGIWANLTYPLRMHARTSLLVGVTAATLLAAACSSGDDPTTLPAVSPPQTSATPIAIPVPAAAQAQTEGGAVAFVQHFIDLGNKAQAGTDVAETAEAIRDASTDECTACHGLVASFEETWLDGGRIEGGQTTATLVFPAPTTFDGDAGLVIVVADVTASTAVRSDDSVYAESAAVQNLNLEFRVIWETGWLVERIVNVD